jgi:predicted dehydrogenase
MLVNRRDFLHLSAATGVAISTRSLLAAESSSTPPLSPRRIGPNDKLNVLSIGVIGTIGGADRHEVASHPMVRIAGLCDVDANSLARAGQDHPDAFRVKDYREAFAKYGSKFDAVIVSTPDHTHCAIDTMALASGKHVYGQKPLVHQLEELTILRRMVDAHPDLSTQLGNQRMSIPGRRAAVFILKTGMLGKAKEAYVVTNSGLKGGGGYFNNRVLDPIQPPPANLDWDLWQSGVLPLMDYRPNCAPVKWRAWWNYGSGGLGDWGCHLLDILFYAYGELDSPISVKAEVKDKITEYFHARTCKSVLTYKVSSDQFATDTFRVHYADEAQQPDRAALGLPPGPWPKETNITCVVCEGGTLVLAATGELQIWRGGKKEDGMKMPGLPVFEPFNHRHAWVDTALGKKSEHWTPFPVGLKITEGTILAVKATRFPDEELHWDRSKLAFTNHAEATRTIVKRDYRKGFEPVRV